MTAPLPVQPEPPLRRIFLAQGTIYCAPTPALVTTILGSCIALCLWDERRHVGGINHYVLPTGGEPGNLRYGDAAVTRLLDRMTTLGCRVEDLRAKLFGGATVLPHGEEETVGHRNLQIALDRLNEYGVRVVARRTGGEKGLYIRFHTASGEVMVRELRAAGAPAPPG